MAIQAKRKKNGHLKPSFGEIFVCSKKELAPFGTVFVVTAENYESEKLGTIFGILKISDLSPDSSYIVNLLTSVMKKEYFLRPERPPEESFEASLRKANLALAEMARHGSTGWAGKIDFAGGAIDVSNLHFSNLGNTSVFLVRSGQIADISRDLDKEKTAEPHPMKTFTDISSGRLEKGDKIIFTTADLLEIFSPDELRHNAARFSKDEFLGLIEASLQANTEMGGAIVIDLVSQTEPVKKIQTPIVYPQKDIEQENKAELPQAPVLPPSSGPMISEIKVPERKREGHLYIQEGSENEAEKKSAWDKTDFFMTNSFRTLVTLLKIAYKRIALFYRKMKIKEKMLLLFREKSKPGHFVEKMRERSRYFSGHLSRLDSEKKKIYFGIALSAVILLMIGIYVSKKVGQEDAPAPDSQPVVQSEPAVPSVIEDVNLKTISNLEPFANFSQKAVSAVLLNGSLFALAENGKVILKIDINSKNVEEITSSLDTGSFKLMAAMPNLNTIFILTEDNKVISFTPVNKNFQENGIGLPSNLNAAGLKTYLTYLYFLDPSANQIYRYPRAEGGFGEKQDWLKSGSDIKNTIDFAINDDLYAVSRNEIIPYLQGKKDANINFEKTSVPLAIDKIYSEPDMEFVYLLDNTNHRIVQYSKDGKIRSQFWNESISGISNFAVDEKNKAIYLTKEKEVRMFSTE